MDRARNAIAPPYSTEVLLAPEIHQGQSKLFTKPTEQDNDTYSKKTDKQVYSVLARKTGPASILLPSFAFHNLSKRSK